MSESREHSTASVRDVRQASYRSPHPILESIDDALRGLRYGTVTVIVQDGVVVQVDRTEKLRFARP